MFAAAALVFISTYVTRVGASLYPTKPIQHTVFYGGAWNDITWKDDKSPPSLDDLGRMEIDLFVDHGEGVCGYPFFSVFPRSCLSLSVPSLCGRGWNTVRDNTYWIATIMRSFPSPCINRLHYCCFHGFRDTGLTRRIHCLPFAFAFRKHRSISRP